MTEFRFEPLSRRWVIAGGERAMRPNEFVDQVEKRQDLTCPFCRGREAETPPAVAEYALPGKSWSVRVVPNKYPAVGNGDTPPHSGIASVADASPLQTSRPGDGVHEVIIESPRHVVDLTDLTDEEARFTFLAYRDRLRALAEQGLTYAQVFKNVGAAAGASIEHSHTQVVGLPWTPHRLREQMTNCLTHFQANGEPLLADLARTELRQQDRVIGQDDALLAWCPFASRFPFEAWVTSLEPAQDFRVLPDREIGRLAKFIVDLVRRIKRAAGISAYNLILHTRPFDNGRYDHYHWHWEILPRSSKQAGFEWATEQFINPCLPEIAAQAVNAQR
jgi:UDPglucose--hexose-1-phosphate uridylyltransferase